MNIDYAKLPSHNVLCIDMKSLYASVEAVSLGLDPLKVMVAVVGDSARKGSVIPAASPMLKRQYQIKTGNRLFEIPSVPNILIVPARMRHTIVTHIFHLSNGEAGRIEQCVIPAVPISRIVRIVTLHCC